MSKLEEIKGLIEELGDRMTRLEVSIMGDENTGIEGIGKRIGAVERRSHETKNDMKKFKIIWSAIVTLFLAGYTAFIAWFLGKL